MDRTVEPTALNQTVWKDWRWNVQKTTGNRWKVFQWKVNIRLKIEYDDAFITVCMINWICILAYHASFELRCWVAWRDAFMLEKLRQVVVRWRRHHIHVQWSGKGAAGCWHGLSIFHPGVSLLTLFNSRAILLSYSLCLMSVYSGSDFPYLKKSHDIYCHYFHSPERFRHTGLCNLVWKSLLLAQVMNIQQADLNC